MVAEHLLEHLFVMMIGRLGHRNFSETSLDELAYDVSIIMDYFQFQSAELYDSFILLGHSQGGTKA